MYYGKEVYRSSDAHVGTPPGHCTAVDRARQAEPERLHRIVQRAVTRRVPERTLVHQPASCAGHHPDLGPRVQRGQTEESPGRAHTRRLRQATRGKGDYHQPRTLNAKCY